MLSACTSSQKPFRIGERGGTGFYSSESLSGNTPAEACKNWAVSISTYSGNVTEHVCQIGTDTGYYPVVKVCDDAPSFTVEKMQDMAYLWSAFLLVAIVIFCLRRVFNIFDKAPHAEG